MRPLPSRNGWMVSNCTCASAALISGGVGSGSSFRKRSKSRRQSASSLAGGGTNTALPGRVPPIQTCERRNSPGVLPRAAPDAPAAPRASRAAAACDSGKPPRSRFRPCSSAATQRLTSRASSTGTPGCSSISYSSRSASDDCVPSICEDSTASLRTIMHPDDDVDVEPAREIRCEAGEQDRHRHHVPHVAPDAARAGEPPWRIPG